MDMNFVFFCIFILWRPVEATRYNAFGYNNFFFESAIIYYKNFLWTELVRWLHKHSTHSLDFIAYSAGEALTVLEIVLLESDLFKIFPINFDDLDY